ncbi:MAG: Holliday junction branch migration protein RuvA, partial [Rhodocyclaceae bacterium]|nr:Holliday junction branch migration protein RuvA [Rhodocyclaceae bacterium]
LELKGKLPVGGGSAAKVGAGGTAAAAHDPMSDILNALLALGYSDREALGAMKSLPAEIGVSDGIRQALKLLAKA